MKNAMKKLLSLVLVAMLLVSAVPFQASAAGGDVTVNIKIGNDEGTTYNVTASETDTFESVYQWVATNLAGMDTSKWEVKDNKYYYKMSGDQNGNYKQPTDPIPGAGRIVVPVVHKPVTLKLDVYFNKTYSTTVTKEVPYGSTVVLNDALAAEAGYGSYKTDVRTENLAEGQSFVADDSAPNIQILIVSGNSETGSTNNSNNTTTTKQPITLQIKNGEGSSYPVVKTITQTPSGDSAKVSDMLYHWYGNKSNDWQNSYTFTKAWSSAQQKDVGYEGSIAAGDTVTVILTPKSTPTTPTNPTTPPATGTTGNISLIVKVNDVTKVQKFVTKQSDTVNNLLKDNLSSDWASKYTFNGFKVEGEPYTYGNPDSTVYAGQTVTVSLSGGTSKYNTCKVRLHVFLNGKVSEEARTFDITSMASDTVISLKEVSNFLLNYYTATTSTGIKFDGLYKAEGAWLGKFVQDKRLDSIEDVDDLLEAGHVDINIMLDNAKAKTTSTADSSNPKTGDAIFAPVAVLTLSTAALAAVYFISKKRVVR